MFLGKKRNKRGSRRCSNKTEQRKLDYQKIYAHANLSENISYPCQLKLTHYQIIIASNDSSIILTWLLRVGCLHIDLPFFDFYHSKTNFHLKAKTCKTGENHI